MQIQRVVEAAVASYEATIFWAAFDEGYGALADDPAAWAEIQEERRGESSALSDGLTEPRVDVGRTHRP